MGERERQGIFSSLMIVLFIAFFSRHASATCLPSLSGIITMRELPGVWLLRDARQGATPSNVSNPAIPFPSMRFHDHRAITARGLTARAERAQSSAQDALHCQQWKHKEFNHPFSFSFTVIAVLTQDVGDDAAYLRCMRLRDTFASLLAACAKPWGQCPNFSPERARRFFFLKTSALSIESVRRGDGAGLATTRCWPGTCIHTFQYLPLQFYQYIHKHDC